MTLHWGIIPISAGEPYGILGIEPGLDGCKASPQPCCFQEKRLLDLIVKKVLLFIDIKNK